MPDHIKSPLIFQALGIAAIWFFVYVIVHDRFAPLVQSKVEAGRGEMTLESEPPELSPGAPLRLALERVYEDGAVAFTKCVICHSEEEGAARFGLPLGVNLVNGPIAFGGHDGAHYRYSRALQRIGASWGIWSEVARLV